MSIFYRLRLTSTHAITACAATIYCLFAPAYATAEIQWYTYAYTPPGVGGFIECDGPTPSSLFPCMLSATKAFYDVFWAAGLANGTVIPFDGVVTNFTYLTNQFAEASASINSASRPFSLDYPFNFQFYTRNIAPSYYIRADRTKQANCNVCTANSVAHPISPSSGAMFDTTTDIPSPASSVGFNRFYNSVDASNSDLNLGWRHSFSRSIRAGQAALNDQGYVAADPYNSALYSTPEEACIAGFVDIKDRISVWRTATVSSSGGCTISVNGNVIDTLPIQNYAQPVGTATVLDVTRDDGQLIRFTQQNGAISAPPSINLTLQQTSSGYTLADANDTVEQYDTNGKLLSITNRSGVVQTMSYDTSGRLSGVSDNFGHQLTLSYDAQNRLITVTRQ